MFNNIEDKVCEFATANISSSDWGQFRKSVLFPPLENCKSIDQQRVSSPLATPASSDKGYYSDYLWNQKQSFDEKENLSLDNISFSEKHRLHFPVNINRQFINHSHKKLKSCGKNIPISGVCDQSSNTYHHPTNNNNMKLRNLFSNITKAVGGNSSNSPSTSSLVSSPQKGKIISFSKYCTDYY